MLPSGLSIQLIYKLNVCRSDITFDFIKQNLVRNNQEKLHVVQGLIPGLYTVSIQKCPNSLLLQRASGAF